MNRQKYEEQRQRELDDSILAGKEWLIRQSKKSGADTDVGKSLYKSVIEPVAASIQEQMDKESLRSRRYWPNWYTMIHDIDTDAVAYLTVLTMLDSVLTMWKKNWMSAREDKKFISTTNAACKVGSAIHQHLFWQDYIDATTAKDRRFADEAVKRQSTEWARDRVQAKYQKNAGVEPRDWSEKQMIDLGIVLIELVIGSCEYFEETENELRYRKREHTPQPVLVLTALGEAMASTLLANLRDRQSMRRPMIVEPIAWESGHDGGYVVPTMNEGIILGPPELVTEQCNLITQEQPEAIFDALNAAQAVAWRVNDVVLDAALWRYRTRDVEFPVYPLPPKPDIGVVGAEKMREWADERYAVNDLNREILSKKVSFKRAIRIALEARKHDAIWFPHKLDKRGRVYPITLGLAPQGNKLEKALLEFTDGKPLGKYGAFWLAVELANAWGGNAIVISGGVEVGLDKAMLEDRVAWIMDNQDLVLRSVSHTKSADSPWLQAENPYAFLRAAHEWCGYLVQGEEYVSHIPVNMDGSNSGIQHYAGLLRDRETAEKVSVVTSVTGPQDIYLQVRDATLKVIAQDLNDGNFKDDEERERLEWWQSNVERAIVKQPAMTFTYSAVPFGMAAQIRKAMRKAKLVDPLLGTKIWGMRAVSMALATRVDRAIRNVVNRPADAMTYIQSLTQELVDSKVRPEWTTPLGFPAIQNYWKSKTKMKRVKWRGGVRNYGFAVNSVVLRGTKHVNAIAPNFIHAMDSTHLMMVINRMADNGFAHLSVIHDSVGCHACDVDELNYAIRDEFVNLYGDSDWLADLEQQFAKLQGKSMETDPEVCRQGDLDLSEVMDSELFFA